MNFKSILFQIFICKSVVHTPNKNYSTFSQNDVVKILKVDKGNVSRSISKLIEKKYLEQDSNNSRVFRLS